METKDKIILGSVGAVILIAALSMPKVIQYSKEEEISKLNKEHAKQTEVLKQEMTSQKEVYETKISSLTLDIQQKETSYQSQIRDLRSKVKITTIKIVKPDGTIEERRVEQSETIDLTSSINEVKKEYELKLSEQLVEATREYENTIQNMSRSWTEETTKYQQEIKKLKEQYEEQKNPRQYRVEAGLLSDNTQYIHSAYDLFNPFFIGSQVEKSKNDFKFGFGIGLRL